jgi:hypothetical protein
LRAAWIGVVILLFARVCLGQAGAASASDRWAPAATLAEVRDLCAQAGLTGDGAAAAEALTDGYLAGLRREERRSTRTLERLWLTHAPDQQQEREAKVEQEVQRRAAAQESLSRSFLGDLRAALPAGGDEAWTRFERRRTRRLCLGQSSRLGVTMDLVEVARAEKLEGSEVADVLDRYERDLHGLLLARRPIAIEADRLDQAVQPDEAANERTYTALRDADCGILRLQRATAAKLMALAPAEHRAALANRLLTARWPGIPLSTPLRERVGALSQNQRLTAEQRAALAESLARFDHRSREIDGEFLTKFEDAQCHWTYAQSGQGNLELSNAWSEEGRKAQADLMAGLERTVSEKELDALEP